MEFKQLQSFVTVVKYMSFTEAAKKLYLSQPTISAHIRTLEEELGVLLLSRTTKHVALTDEGQQFYEEAARLLTLRDRMVHSCTAGWAQEIRLGASTIPSAYVLPDCIAAYQKQHPAVRFIIRQGDSREIIRDLTDRIFDIGIVGMETQQPGIVCEALCRDRMVLITPATPEYLALQAENRDYLTAILSGPVLVRESGSGSGRVLSRLLADRSMKEGDLRVAVQSDDTTAICQMAAAGVGAACVSERAARLFSEQGHILMFPLPEAESARVIYLLTREGGTQQEHVRQFADFLRKTLKE